MHAELAGFDRAWPGLRLTLGPLIWLLLRPRVVGRRNVVDGPFLIVSNHESWWDIPALGWASRGRSARWPSASCTAT